MHVVTMHRWGDEETHNYVVGAFKERIQAIRAAKDEWEQRGGKYEAKITNCSPYTEAKGKIVEFEELKKEVEKDDLWRERKYGIKVPEYLY